MKYISILFLLITTLGCQQNDKTYKGQYFDLKGFIESEAERLNKQNASLLKQVTINDKQEEKQQEDIDWTKELQVFADADINQPAFEGLYKVDTTFINPSKGMYSEVIYQATGTNLPTQYIKLFFLRTTHQVYKLEISSITDNFLTDKVRTMEYISGHSYLIEQDQKIVLMRAKKMIISGKIINDLSD